MTTATAVKGNRSLLPPITLNTQLASAAPPPPPPPLSNKPNGSTKRPNPTPTTFTSLESSRRSSRHISQLDDMELPPTIPAALEERGYRSRPSSSHQQQHHHHHHQQQQSSPRWNDELDDGLRTPTRRSSGGSGSTTAWAGHSPASSNAAGPSNSTRARRRRGGFFGGANNDSSASVDDGGDEMDYGGNGAYGGASTPRSRRSVVFRGPGAGPGAAAGTGTGTGTTTITMMGAATRPSADYSTGEELETPIAIKRPSIFQRLRNFGGAHGRSQSGWTVDTMDDGTTQGPFTPATERANYAASDRGPVDDGAESDDLPGGRQSRRRRSLSSAAYSGTTSTPATPRHSARRRATLSAAQVAHPPPDDGNETDRSRSRYGFSRRSSFRNRIVKRRSTEGGDRPSYMSNYRDPAAKWNQLKASIRMIGGKKPKEVSKIDREKSAELVAELSAATPAAVILASMFQRDEHGHRRIPILLEQLKVRITDSHHSQKGGGRSQATFRLELEYGSGLTRMKWVVNREFRDFFNLHSRYRLSNISDTTFSGRGDAHRLPKFPRGTIPYLRGVRGLATDDESGDDAFSGPERQLTDPNTPGPSSPAAAAAATTTTTTAAATPHHGHGLRKKRPLARRMSSTLEDFENATTTGLAAGIATLASVGAATGVQHAMAKTGRDGFNTRQRQQLEDYMRRLIRIMVFRPDSNRLCKFLELSALGVRLAAEGSYHGKEGYLIIRSSKGSDFRRPWNPSQVARRHSPKWFLVRHSYIVCVDSPEEMNIYDVFLVDSNFNVETKHFLGKRGSGGGGGGGGSGSRKSKDIVSSSNPARPQHHGLTVRNHERTVKLLAKNERQLQQFQVSMEWMKKNSPWSAKQRFESFAPVRKGVFAQWLVDGRDYFWNVSRAISMAKDVIYIHDWWLSPELYLRRPAAVSQKWRLDRLLQKKAQEGVKIFVIVYRNIGAAIPIDSSYTKYSLLDLHPNIFVQRSPNQIRQNTFFWAHHEKILVVDHMIAFVGGIDLCFGRWDTPQHSIVDNKPSGFEEGSTQSDPDNFQLWPGKDYSNPRVQDFFNLDKPYEDMYDRAVVPRMPWHDIHMQIVGQPARDLTRHFVQRWNYLLRQRTPSRPTPLLLPPPDFSDGELESLGIDGSCEVQILRSASSWSLGTPTLVERSIQMAYLKAIEMSEHLVYIENQFFITSTNVGDTQINNSIGDALVERIIRAHKNEEDWRAIVIIPLMPGFQNAVDAQDGSSVRLIMHCQFLSISQGENSIFGRLRALEIEPSEYIEFFSLRNWGKLGKPGSEKLVTEQLYIHAKCMVVDDRIAIIGSANINERSMNGDRDSEVAAIVRDTDTIMSTMAGMPYRVGRFPHTLRVRLMREHLGLDVDEIMESEFESAEQQQWEEQVKKWHDETASVIVDDYRTSAEADDATAAAVATAAGERRQRLDEEVIERMEKLRSFNHDVDWEQENNPNLKAKKKGSADPRITATQHQQDVRGFGADHMVLRESERASVSVDRATLASPNGTVRSRRRSWSHPPASSGRDCTADAALVAADADAGVYAGAGAGAGAGSGGGGGGGGAPYGTNSLASPVSNPRSRSSSHVSQFPPIMDGELPLPPYPSQPERSNMYELGLPQPLQLPPLPNTSDVDIGGPPASTDAAETQARPTAPPTAPPDIASVPPITADMVLDPLSESFYLDVWRVVARNNTELYRRVFRCQPDNEVKSWTEYKDAIDYLERFNQKQDQRNYEKAAKAAGRDPEGPGSGSGGGGTGDGGSKDRGGGDTAAGIRLNLPEDGCNNGLEIPRDSASTRPRGNSQSSRLNTATTTGSATNATHPSGSGGSLASGDRPGDLAGGAQQSLQSGNANNVSYAATVTAPAAAAAANGNAGTNGAATTNQRRRRRATTRSRAGNVMEPERAESMLNMIQGHLVLWPYDWLVKQQETGNWLYNIDQLAPIEI